MGSDTDLDEPRLVEPVAARKAAGAYYTAPPVVTSLLKWAVRSADDRLLDPSCGDGRFIAGHRNSVGVEQDPQAAHLAIERAPWALVHVGEFFAWADQTNERFECAAGNPPFIRYQTFKGEVRKRAFDLCAAQGVEFSGLSSSWAPFLVAAASLLKPGGRLAFVVPAEIGHAPYAAPLLEYLVANFGVVHITAVRKKLFPELSEDCWLLYAEGRGRKTRNIRFTALESFYAGAAPPARYINVAVREWREQWKRRLRPFLLPAEVLEHYRDLVDDPLASKLGGFGAVGIGYVSGANDFFHLRPSQARALKIPERLLAPAVRNGRVLPARRLTKATLAKWCAEDEPMLLLRLPKTGTLPKVVRAYLNGAEAKVARTAYKCRVRSPWYSVPDVHAPDFFLSYMSSVEPRLVRNSAGAVCTNSVHGVRLSDKAQAGFIDRAWRQPFTLLSCELEGHPLGGGMLKLEPREACEVALLPQPLQDRVDATLVESGLAMIRAWRHHGRAD